MKPRVSVPKAGTDRGELRAGQRRGRRSRDRARGVTLRSQTLRAAERTSVCCSPGAMACPCDCAASTNRRFAPSSDGTTQAKALTARATTPTATRATTPRRRYAAESPRRADPRPAPAPTSTAAASAASRLLRRRAVTGVDRGRGRRSTSAPSPGPRRVAASSASSVAASSVAASSVVASSVAASSVVDESSVRRHRCRRRGRPHCHRRPGRCRFFLDGARRGVPRLLRAVPRGTVAHRDGGGLLLLVPVHEPVYPR